MRFLRTFSIALAIALTVLVLFGNGGSAYAQDNGNADKQATAAGDRAKTAAGLVDVAVANRAELEAQLAAAMTQIADISDQLSVVAANLTKIESQILFAGAELSSIQDAIEAQAVDAYINALTLSPLSFVNSDSVETAMVAGVVVDEIVSSNQRTVDQLIIKKRDLESLHTQQATRQEEVAALQQDLDAEVEHLANLYDQADAEVAAAIRASSLADAEYRAALSAAQIARDRAAEQERQDKRPPASTTTTTTTTGSTGTISPPITSPPTTSPPTTSGNGGWTGIPAVEQWRELVTQYFPANRVDEALQIMQCESLGDPDAYNPYSGASGLFQFLPSTWATTAPRAGYPGASPFEPEPNIASAAWLANAYSELGLYYWQAWSCRRVLE